MKQISFISFSLLAVAILISCKKSDLGSIENVSSPELAVSNIQDKYDGKILVTTLSGHNGLSGRTIISGYFKNNNQYVNIGNLSINGIMVSNGVSQGVNNSKVEFYDNSITPTISPSIEQLKGMFGSKVRITISGNEANGYGPGNDEFELPIIISSDPNVDSNRYIIQKDKDFLIKWSGSASENRLFIEVSSKSINGSEVAANYRKSWVEQISDNGSYNIPWNVLKEFDPNSELKINLFRYSAGEMECGSKTVSFIAYNRHTYGIFRFVNSN